MNNPKHTKGPWKVELSGSPNKYVAEIWNQNTKVALINHEHLNHDVDDMANARLIASAPELLEALLSAKSKILERLNFIEQTYGLEQDKEAFLRDIESAIAKATGGNE